MGSFSQMLLGTICHPIHKYYRMQGKIELKQAAIARMLIRIAENMGGMENLEPQQLQLTVNRHLEFGHLLPYLS